MKAANSAFVTGALAIRNGAISTSCAHFSLSKMKPSAAVELMLEHIRQISEHAVAVGQVQIPAGRMGDRARIPQAVRAVEDRRTAVGMTKRPVFVEPADMPDLPEYGIDDRQHRSHQLLH